MNFNVPHEFQIPHEKISSKVAEQMSDQLLNHLINGSLVEANQQVAQILAMGNTGLQRIWNTFFLFYFAQISLTTPQLVDYLYQKYLLSEQIKKWGHPEQNQQLRNHLCELICVLCLSPRPSDMPLLPEELEISVQTSVSDKTAQIISCLDANLSPRSQLYYQLASLIVSLPEEIPTLSLLYWFVTDTQYQIHPFPELKVPPSLSRRCVWLIWKLILIQVSQEQVPLVDSLLQIFLVVYPKKNLTASTYLLWFLIQAIIFPQKLKWSFRPNLSHPTIIQMCLEVNYLYRSAFESSEQMEDNRWLDQGKNRDFWETMINYDLLLGLRPEKVSIPSPEKDELMSIHLESGGTMPSETASIKVQIV